MIRLNDSMKSCQITTAAIVSPMISAAINFIYPPTCLFCDQEVNPVGNDFCDSCLSKLKPVHSLECPRCGAPVGLYTDLTRGCGQCHRESFAFDGVIRLGVYEGQMRLASLRAKASGGGTLARGLANLLVSQKRSRFDEQSFDLVIPIPEHWTRRIVHSHYAAETISRQIARRLHACWSRRILLKSRRTPKQATSPTPLRRQHQQGSFAVPNVKQISGKSILLVDDILTTGSTAHAAAKTLKNAGAAHVTVAVIAVSPLRK